VGLLDGDINEIGDFPDLNPTLRSYAYSAVTTATAVCHLGIIPGEAHMPLIGLRLRRHVETAKNPAKRASLQPVGEQAPSTAAEVMDRDADCVILAGPGAGKSTLLRTALVEKLRGWPLTDREVPVLVRADALTGDRSLAESIAAAVTADLADPTAPGQAWPTEFFDAPPLPGARWLVLVDGLNEIADGPARRGVLRKLTEAARQTPLVYRFVVGTRPLPDGELPQAPEWRAERYELLPPAEGQLETIAARWLTELGCADPATAAAQIVAYSRRSPAIDWRKVPLTIAVLCLLRDEPLEHGESADPPMDGRFALYKAFAQYLAWQAIRSGSSTGAVPHLTVAEYRAACETAVDPARSAAAFIDMFGQRERAWDPSERDWSYRSFLIAAWAAQPDLSERLTSGLRSIAARGTRAGCQFMAVLTSDGVALDPSVTGAAAASLVRLAAKRTGRSRTDRGEDFTERSLAVDALGRLGDPRAADLARELIDEATTANRRAFLASALLTTYSPDTVGQQEVKDLLSRFTSGALADLALTSDRTGQADLDEHDEDDYRLTGQRAGDLLGPLAALMRRKPADDPSGRDLRADDLADRAADPAQSGYNRRVAAQELARRGDPRAADLLAVVASADKADRFDRREARLTLAKLGDPRAADLAIAATGGTRPLGASGLAVAQALVRAGSPRGMELLLAIASAPGTPQQSSAARTMAKLGDLRGRELLETAPIPQPPPRTRPGTWHGWLRVGLAETLSACAIASPFAGGFLLGLALADSGGSRPGTGNWVAFAVSVLVLANLAIGLMIAVSHAIMFTFRVRYRYPYAKVGLPLVSAGAPFIVIGYAVSDFLPASLHGLGDALWAILIWRF
jgi:hypothetical protein